MIAPLAAFLPEYGEADSLLAALLVHLEAVWRSYP
jgi:hypothetical protein